MADRVGYDPDGTTIQKVGGLIGLYGKAPIAQQTAPTLVTSVNPTTSGSALVASVHSIAVYAASTVNLVVRALSNIGVYL